MRVWCLSLVILFSRSTYASLTSFSVNDDVFAFPQYEVVFSESYIPYSVAIDEIKRQHERTSTTTSSDRGEVSLHDRPGVVSEDQTSQEEHQLLKLHNKEYFCTIPIVYQNDVNKTNESPSEADKEKELARAADKGRELLQGMEGNQCLFYSTGWWTYSFCYNSQVRQFHSLSPGANGGRVWPPQEDPTTPSYVLGKFDLKASKGSSSGNNPSKTELAELQTKAETNYLVQRLEGGTTCDLTGDARKIEIQFHCNPQLTDRIGWIKETSTCSYLMIVYTPRLCNDIAFLPPKEARANTITCREVLTDDEVPAWATRKKNEAMRKMIGQGAGQKLMVGNIEIGGMKLIGRDGKKIERGRIVLTQEERAETIIVQKNGQISSMSKSDLKKLDLDYEDVEAFRKELQAFAGNKDWKIERLDDANGRISLRGVVTADDEETESSGSEKDQAKPEDSPGSEEEYKDEV